MKTEDIENDLKLNFKEFVESGDEELDKWRVKYQRKKVLLMS